MIYTEKTDAGERLLAICKDYSLSVPTEVFRMEIYYETVNAHYCMNFCGKAKYEVDLYADVLRKLSRIENELSKLLLNRMLTRSKRRKP